MGLELAKAFVKIRGDDSGLSGDLKSVENQFKETLGSIQTAAAGMFAAVSAAGVGVLKSGVTLAARMEDTKLAFATLLGSAEEAKKTIADLTRFAIDTPFTMPGILKAARMMIAFGERGDTMIDTLRILGNAAAGTNTDFGLLALVFNQVRGVGKLLTQDFRQLSTRGVISLQDLADHFGVTAAEAQKMLTTGQIGFEDLRSVLSKMSAEGGRFFNLMVQQSDTLNGRISTLSDNFNIMKRLLGEDLAKAFKGVVGWVNKAVMGIQDLLKEGGSVIPWALTATTVVAGLAAGLLGAGAAATFFGVSIGTVLVTLSGVGVVLAFAAAIGGLAAALKEIGVGWWERWNEDLLNFQSSVGSVTEKIDKLSATVTHGGAISDDAFQKVLDKLHDLMDASKDFDAEQTAAVEAQIKRLYELRDQYEATNQAASKSFDTLLDRMGRAEKEMVHVSEAFQVVVHESSNLEEALEKLSKFANKELVDGSFKMVGDVARREFSGVGDAIDNLVLDLAVAKGEMSEIEREARKFDGATKDQLDTFKSYAMELKRINEQQDALAQRQQEFAARAEQIKQSVMSPFESIRSEMGDLIEVWREGAISVETFRRKMASLREEQSVAALDVIEKMEPSLEKIKDPFKRMQARFGKLRELFQKGLIDKGALRTVKEGILDTFKEERAAAITKAFEQNQPKPLLGAGRHEVSQFGSTIQDALLQSSQEKLDQDRNAKLDALIAASNQQIEAIKQTGKKPGTLT